MSDKYSQNRLPELRLYINCIKNPTEDFRKFLNDYFGPPMIRGRVEEDTSVWERLKDKEFDIAKQMILDNLGHDSAYIRAICIFKDKRGISLLENLIETLDDRFCYEKLSAAKGLFDWIGYEPYLGLLDNLLPKSGSFTKTSLDEWISGIDKSLAIRYIFLMLQDEDSFVRWCAYGTLKRYLNLGEQEYTETKYYTDDAVYSDKALLKTRLNELRKKLSIE